MLDGQLANLCMIGWFAGNRTGLGFLIEMLKKYFISERFANRCINMGLM